jgi:hypothetical protein
MARSENKVLSGVRFVWLNLFTPRTTDSEGNKLDTPVYDLVVLVPKTHHDPAQCANYMTLWGLVAAVNFEAFRSQQLVGRNPIKDGDNPTYRDGRPNLAQLEKYPWYRGHWYFTASTQRQPNPKQIVGPDNQPLLPGMLKGGDWGSISVNAWTFDKGAANRGVNFGFEALRKERNGEPIGNAGEGRDADEIFGAPIGPALQDSQGFAAPQAPSMPPLGQPSAPPPSVPYGQQPQAFAPPVAQPAATPNALGTAFGSATSAYPSNPQPPQGFAAPQGFPTGAPVAAPGHQSYAQAPNPVPPPSPPPAFPATQPGPAFVPPGFPAGVPNMPPLGAR